MRDNHKTFFTQTKGFETVFENRLKLPVLCSSGNKKPHLQLNMDDLEANGFSVGAGEFYSLSPTTVQAGF